mmetsp:Transcript_25558/g.41553  ORF Transcript_25558/g.41553 Transcript_25558/m.41553 type:complete len:110 (+) Transcript_25558:33-362(+)
MGYEQKENIFTISMIVQQLLTPCKYYLVHLLDVLGSHTGGKILFDGMYLGTGFPTCTRAWIVLSKIVISPGTPYSTFFFAINSSRNPFLHLPPAALRASNSEIKSLVIA